MNADEIRKIALQFPHATETLNWGNCLVFWAGPREVGGKMFAIFNLDGEGALLSFCAGADRFHELLERDGMTPAPHLARAHWVALTKWSALRPRELAEELRRAYEIVLSKLPTKTRAVLDLPTAEYKKALAVGKAKYEAAAKAKKENPFDGAKKVASKKATKSAATMRK